MADPAYDCKEIRDLFKSKNINVLIPQNRRNTKNPLKIVKFTAAQKKKYKKRLIIERTFNRLKNNKRLMARYDRKLETFVGFVYVSKRVPRNPEGLIKYIVGK